MLSLDWNALRAGDSVLVHAASGPGTSLSSGVVAQVNVLKSSNGVGIRVHTDGQGSIIWPSRLAVHLDPPNPSEPCWRCTGIKARKLRVRPSRASHPRVARDAWAEWRAQRSAASAADFCAIVSSWIEGTAAQLLRPRWPSSAQPPSAAAVEMRLRHHLALDACADEAEYPKALALARRQVVEDLRQRREGCDDWIEEGTTLGAASTLRK